ncbi:MAG: hypothetical protein HY606_00620, partial [Planctomycetes bacterium]|nr:hypothetical protein [Planctomycetota bacterium]
MSSFPPLFNNMIMELGRTIDFMYRNVDGVYATLCKAYLESTSANCGGNKIYTNEQNNELNKQVNGVSIYQPVNGITLVATPVAGS